MSGANVQTETGYTCMQAQKIENEVPADVCTDSWDFWDFIGHICSLHPKLRISNHCHLMNNPTAKIPG